MNAMIIISILYFYLHFKSHAEMENDTVYWPHTYFVTNMIESTMSQMLTALNLSESIMYFYVILKMSTKLMKFIINIIKIG